MLLTNKIKLFINIYWKKKLLEKISFDKLLNQIIFYFILYTYQNNK